MARKKGLSSGRRPSQAKTTSSSDDSQAAQTMDLDSSSEYNETNSEQDAQEYEPETQSEPVSDQVLNDDDEESTAPQKRQKLTSGQSKKVNAKATQKSTRKSRPKTQGKKAKGTASSADDSTAEAQTSDQDGVEVDESGQPTNKKKATYKDSYETKNGIADDRAPLEDIEPIFQDMLLRSCRPGPDFKGDLEDFVREQWAEQLERKSDTLMDLNERLKGRPITMATMCSGTEAPLLAVQLFSRILEKYGIDLSVDHRFSGEIVPYKQHYIEYNFHPDIIFRDITELTKDIPEGTKDRTATTAYGGQAVVPGNIDLLVAGCSCVDYSNLNGSRKELESKGESGATFLGMLKYCEEFSPTITILENVISAPWVDGKIRGKEDSSDIPNQKHGIDWYMEQAGYLCKFVKMDTKDCYLPHTRVRGYMVCVKKTGKVDTELVQLLNAWETLVQEMKRPCSVPVEWFLLRSDDPRLDVSTEENESGSSRKPTSWDKCKTGHDEYRVALGLGTKKTLTDWLSGGSFLLPDFWKTRKLGLGERVLDTLEIAHLRNLSRGFDDRYYNRLLELSQNVYRVTDTIKTGIIGCLTPTGMPFSTTRGGKINGLEALKLQGIPTNSVELGMLSQHDLQDMAGNAMSSTAVGICMLSALIVFRDRLNLKGRKKLAQKTPITGVLAGEKMLRETVSNPADYEPISVQEAVAQAKLTRRMCDCEGRHTKQPTDFEECQVCRRTTCIEHGYKPKHHYSQIPIADTNRRKNPFEFEKLIRKSIPSKINLSDLSTQGIDDFLAEIYQDHAADIDSKIWKQNLEAIKAALNSEVCLRSARRDQWWEFVYDSPHAKLMLFISRSSVEWRLFCHLPTEPLSSRMGKYLREHPIARMRPSGDDIVAGTWSFWLPKEREFLANITMRDPSALCYEGFAGMPTYSDHFVFKDINIDIPDHDSRFFDADIRGAYQLSQQCGQPFNSLHVQVSSMDSADPMFLFLEQHLRTGDPKSHYFVFSQEEKRLEKDEHRTKVARVHHAWRQTKVAGTQKVGSSEYRLKVAGSEDLIDASNLVLQEQTKVYSDGFWVETKAISINLSLGPSIKYRQLPKSIPNSQKNTCQSSQQAVLVCEANSAATSSRSWPRNQWTEVDRAIAEKFYHDYGWALRAGSVIGGHTEASELWHRICQSTCPPRCLKCAPLKPKLLWAFNKSGKQAPYEDPFEATAYEKVLKERPSPVTVKFLIDDDDQVLIKVGINPETLIHMAIARLDPSSSSKIETSFRLVTDDDTTPKVVLTPLVLKDTKDMEPARQPPNFKIDLREEQLRNLSWALDQERATQVFIEQEVAEGRLELLSYRLEGKALREVIRRGGVMAHDVGFGKTVLVLALIQSQVDFDKAHSEKAIKGAIPVKGSLILVPAHLTDQWHREIDKFLTKNKDRKILVIKTMANLKKAAIKDFQEADYIIACSSLFKNESYRFTLAQFTGMVELDDKATSRARREWLKIAIEKAHENTDLLREDPTNFQALVEVEYERNVLEAGSNEAPIPSKRFRGAAFVKASAARETECNSKKRQREESPQDLKARNDVFNLSDIGTGDIEWTDMKSPLFEMFSFARKIVDEFTYIDSDEALMIERLNAHCSWVLSGTPPVGGFADVKKMAKFVGINLGIDDYSSMARDTFKNATDDMTSSELFLTYQKPPSNAWKRARHSHAQRFLDQFVRKDEAELGDIEFEEILRLVDLTASEKAIFLELMQRLAAANFENRRTRHTDSNMDNLIDEALAGCADVIQALLLRASYFEISGNKKNGTAFSACQLIVEQRQKEYVRLRDDLIEELQKAEWLNRQKTQQCDQLDNWKKRVASNHYGDGESTSEVVRLINRVEEEYHEDDWVYFYREKETDKNKDGNGMLLPLRPEGWSESTSTKHLKKKVAALRVATTELSRKADGFVNHIRSLRFFQALRAIQLHGTGGMLICSKCSSSIARPDQATLLTKCGHLVCNTTCHQANNESCPVPTCHALNRSYQKIPGQELGHDDSHSGKVSNGSKIDEIVELFKDLPEGEKVLLFIQFDNLHEKVKDALERADIHYADLNSGSGAAKATTLTKFQDDKVTKTKTDGSLRKANVLILNIGDASASGSNLTIANHVIFAHPYHIKGSSAQQKYEATMTQAIGRARRFGQKKEVHIYHFMTTNTIDVDIFEHRTKKIVKRHGTDKSTKKFGYLIDQQEGVTSQLGSPVAQMLFSRREYA